MLLEKLIYSDDFPINITVATFVEDPLHYHLDIEIIYVLNGAVRLKNGSCWYELHSGDIFVNSGHEVHGIYTLSRDNVVARIQISTHYFSQFFPDLSKACYRTYSRKPNGRKHDLLKELLLQILLKHSMQRADFKSECICLTADVIKHLNKYFNLFSFDKDLVVDFDKSNPVAIERISRICQYIYQYYSDNITLEDLGAMERLNTFHLSHMIKRFTGMSFRNFLCFARVEWSEIPLLDSDAKVSRIARDVGFSTTAYYTKYFKKWFKCTPEEYRAHYLPHVKGDLHPTVLELPPKDYIEKILMAANACSNMEACNKITAPGIKLDVTINANAATNCRFDKKLNVIVTAADYQKLGMRMLSLLEALKPWRVILACNEDRNNEDQETPGKICQLLEMAGFTVEKQPMHDESEIVSAAFDSIIYPIHLLRHIINTDGPMVRVFLRDQCENGGGLCGRCALVTPEGICKPSFFICQAISNTRGHVISQSNQYCVIRDTHGGRLTLKLFVYNASEDLLSMCRDVYSKEDVKNAINDFRDEIRVGMCINLQQGKYTVAKYSFTKDDNIFSYHARMGFSEQGEAFYANFPEWWAGSPKPEVFSDVVHTVLNLQFNIKGIGMQIADIYPVEQR